MSFVEGSCMVSAPHSAMHQIVTKHMEMKNTARDSGSKVINVMDAVMPAPTFRRWLPGSWTLHAIRH